MPQHYTDPSRETDPHALPDLEVFYTAGREDSIAQLGKGWYYWACFPGCLPDSDPIGPFDSEQDALADATCVPGGVIMPHEHDTLAAGLAMVFGREWLRLTVADRQLIIRDCTEDGGVQDLAEYRRNIGTGNLDAYVRCQRIRFAPKGAAVALYGRKG